METPEKYIEKSEVQNAGDIANFETEDLTIILKLPWAEDRGSLKEGENEHDAHLGIGWVPGKDGTNANVSGVYYAEDKVKNPGVFMELTQAVLEE